MKFTEGMQTSEFLVTCVALVLFLFVKFEWQNAVAMAVVLCTYIYSRMHIKKKVVITDDKGNTTVQETEGSVAIEPMVQHITVRK